MKRTLSVVLTVLVFVSGVFCQKEKLPPALASLVAAERAFARMSVEKGLREAFLTFFADDGINFQPHPVKTKETILKEPAPTGRPTLIVSWEPTCADVSQAGDLGYTTGPAVLTDQSTQKKPPRYGTYFTIWKKQLDGSWRAVLDAGTDGPGGPPVQPAIFKAARPSLWKRARTKISLTDERASLMNVDRELLTATNARGLANASLDYLSDEARLHRWGNFPLIGKDVIRSFLSAKTSAMTWQPIGSDISGSGDLGYTYGSYELKDSPASEAQKGYYVRVWKRDARGDWKIALDTLSPLPPEDKETALNAAGYQLLKEKRTKEAIEVFKQAVAASPNSANAYDSLSDAYEADGNRELAIEFAQKALDILPNDPSTNQELKNRVKDSATEKLRRLRGH